MRRWSRKTSCERLQAVLIWDSTLLLPRLLWKACPRGRFKAPHNRTAYLHGNRSVSFLKLLICCISHTTSCSTIHSPAFIHLWLKRKSLDWVAIWMSTKDKYSMHFKNEWRKCHTKLGLLLNQDSVWQTFFKWLTGRHIPCCGGLWQNWWQSYQQQSAVKDVLVW